MPGEESAPGGARRRRRLRCRPAGKGPVLLRSAWGGRSWQAERSEPAVERRDRYDVPWV